ncbi:MAG: hypothetical protein PHF09_02370 [Candidatus Nanoarchaeia archaeon]|jgi:hypothetical protein|nr:hypothetical protein [Candidatus Nanoarchaeia archaeon]
MRKIKTKQQLEKEQKKKQTILSILLITLLGFSTIGYAFFSSTGEKQQAYNYKNLNFIQQNDLWYTQINNNNYVFNYLPDQLKEIPINTTITIQNLENKPLYIVSPQDISYILTSNLQNHILRFQEACINLEECSEITPLKNCSTDNIIIINSSSEKTQITQDQNCIFLEGDISKAANKFVYSLFNIE